MSQPKVQIRSAHRFNVPAERIFDTFLDAEKAKTFMFTTLTGKMIRAEIDARVGGGFVFVERRPGGRAEHYGKFIVMERPHRLAFKFSVQEDAPDGDLVTVDIIPLAKGGCEVLLTHEVSAEFADLKESIEEGWDGILDGLGEALRQK
ncbi:MAG: SRPBCC domain-containing protein [Calothrix sp. SM1_5_4]|nr:SRPBCC domain-containing protein [Calothrix sp. SM1_5_4]